MTKSDPKASRPQKGTVRVRGPSKAAVTAIALCFLLVAIPNNFFPPRDEARDEDEPMQRQPSIRSGGSVSADGDADADADASPLLDVQIFDLPHGYAEPAHMDPIDPSILLHRGFVGIDTAHRTGRVHAGSVMFVVDSDDRILLLKRSPDVVTCPNKWGIVGEHHYRDEIPGYAARRGLREELGEEFEAVHVAEVRNLTAWPLYYIRNYGPTNGNRIDRQVTYLWEVRLKGESGGVIMDLDEEVAGHKWVDLDLFGRWLREDAESGEFESFCHETLVVMLQIGLRAVERLRTEKSR